MSTTRTDTLPGPLAGLASGLKAAWWVVLIVGIAWVVIGFVVLQFNGASLATVAALVGVLLLLATAGEVFRAVVTKGGWRVWHVVFAVLLLIAAVTVFAAPGAAIVTLAITVGFYFVFAGIFDIISSLFETQVPGWWLQLLSGIAELVLGFLASGSAGSSLVVLLTYIAITAIFRGVAEIAAAFAVRSLTTR